MDCRDSYLKTDALAKTFSDGALAAVRGISLDIRRSEIFCLLGPSGCGKTTTLRLLAGFEKPDAGKIFLEGKDITSSPPEARNIGIVFQDYALFPHFNVLENIAFALWAQPRKARKAMAKDFLELVGLSDFAKHMPHEISGGQQQRAALARALAAEPKILLLDEPFSGLDTRLRQSLREETRHLLRRRGTTCILVTHDQEEAMSFADRIALMNNGRIEQTGAPEEVYAAPSNPFVAQFLGRTNLIEGLANGLKADTPIGIIPIDKNTSGRVLLSLRPEHIVLEPANSSQQAGILVRREFKGHDMTHWVKFGDTDIQVDTDFTCKFDAGTPVLLRIRKAATVLSRSEI